LWLNIFSLFLINITILFSDQEIYYIEALQYIRDSHINIILKNFPLGICIKFEHYIEQFQTKYRSNKSNLNFFINIINNNINQTNSISFRMPGEVKNIINESFKSGQILLNNVQDSLILDYYKTNAV